MSPRSPLRALALASIVLFGALVVLVVGLVVRSTRPPDPQELAVALASFRAQGARDLLAAAKAHGGDAVARRASSLEADLWPVSPPRVGWSWLLSTAVATVAGPASERPLAAIYNPWADVVLVVEWKREEGRLRIADFDVLPADCVRRGGKAPFAFETAWLRPDRFPPAALPAVTADTLGAFERLFPGGADEKAWRARLAPGGDEAWAKVVRPAAGLLCGRALVGISEYRHPERGEPRLLSAVRPALDRALAEARAGRGAALAAKAPATPAASRLALAAAPLDGLAVTSLQVGGRRAYAFAVDPVRPGRVVAFTFDAKDGTPRLVRIDALNLPGAPWRPAGDRS